MQLHERIAVAQGFATEATWKDRTLEQRRDSIRQAIIAQDAIILRLERIAAHASRSDAKRAALTLQSAYAYKAIKARELGATLAQISSGKDYNALRAEMTR